MYEWIYLVAVFLFILIIACIKIKYPFWNIQPVYHPYDYIRKYTSFTPFYIQKYFPPKTKFCDFEQIRTFSFWQFNEEQKREIVDFLQCHYISSENILHLIQAADMDALFTGHTDPAYISVFHEKHYRVMDVSDNSVVSTPEIIQSEIPVGCITSRPIILHMNYSMDIQNLTTKERESHSSISLYYWDYICVHRDHLSKNLSRKLIQTHEYNVRFQTPNIRGSLFKKEIDLCSGIVPLVQYESYTFYMQNKPLSPLPPHLQIVPVQKENFQQFNDFMLKIRQSSVFELTGTTEISNMEELIKQRLIYIYMMKRKEHIFAVYFIKNTKIQIETAHSATFQLLGSIQNIKSDELFISGFAHAIRQLLNQRTQVRVVMMDDIGHNAKIIQRWREMQDVILQHPCAYYLYNMVYPKMPLSREKCLFII